MNWDLKSTLTLNNGVPMPRLGLGVWKASPADTRNAVAWALEAGYRHIDTARIYDNETDVGVALKESGVAREEVFVTTKLWNDDHGLESAKAAFSASLNRLGLDYVDLYLSHFPVPERRIPAWKAMETLLNTGRCRAIGVSNYTIRHLEELLRETSIVPAVNQVEFHPFLFQKELLEYCREKGIQLEAYSPLTHGKRLDHPLLKEVGDKYGKSPAQVLIRWALQHDLVVIPKSVKQPRIRENAAVFDFALDDGEMEALNGLNENLRTCWDPTSTP